LAGEGLAVEDQPAAVHDAEADGALVQVDADEVHDALRGEAHDEPFGQGYVTPQSGVAPRDPTSPIRARSLLI
jgi:hypothetical protein